MAKLREVALLAVTASLLFLTIAFLGRNTLNPDGVSYLDLADALRRGDVGHFVQAYWSPLYPCIMAILGFITGSEGADLPGLAHWLNAGAAATAAIILWTWAKHTPHPFFARAAFAALLITSAGPPRIETISPDVLLLAIMTWICYELIVHHGTRWLRTGALFGVAFLAKTSCWPWLIAAFIVRLWGASHNAELPAPSAKRRAVLLSSAVTLGVMLLWILPVSRKEGQFTLTSATRLNYCWYLEGCDSQTPDKHLGDHRAYRDVPVSDSSHVRWAKFDNTSTWTYEPWSDPTEWSKGVLTQKSTALPFGKLVKYWLKLAQLTFLLWELPLFLAVLIPVIWIGRRPGMWKELGSTRRDAAVLMILGFIGLCEFVAVHVEPRLIAPFAMMFALGTLSWALADSSAPELPPVKGKATQRPLWRHPWVVQVAASIGLVVALYFCWQRLEEGFPANARIKEVVDGLRRTNASLASRGIDQRRIVVFGPAVSVMGTAYWVGGHIVGQMLPGSNAAFSSIPADRQRQFVDSLFADIADVAWLVDDNGGMKIIPLVPIHP